jgi:TolB-like protein
MIGETISHYQITGKLGEGGMGVVYQAEDTKLKRTVALKFLPPELTRDPDAKSRFVHEARAASALDHPNVCTIHEIDETEDGQLFLAMARYQGETLKARIARGPLPLDEALDIARQVAEGLAEAHQQEIVHRDIKPANLFLTQGGLVKILDFGLAKLADQTQLTRTGTTLGTAHYMSPEQAGGQIADGRSDLWSLGVILYEMITGRVPFAGDHAQAVTYAILNTEPEPVTGLRTGVPLEAERIIGKCLAKDPSMRYQHPGDLLADLRALQQQTTVRPTVTMFGGAARGRTLRHWPWIAGCVLAVVVAGIFAARSFRSAPGTGHEDLPRLVVLPFENLGDPEDEYFADGISDEISVKLARIDGLLVLARNSAQHYKNAAMPLSEIGKELGVGFALTGTIRWSKAVDGSSKVNIAPRLVRIADGTQLWANAYREDYQDIFGIQARIATMVADAMGVELGSKFLAQMEQYPDVDPMAYDLYLRGLEYETSWTMADRAARALTLFNSAVALDPDFVCALGKVCWMHAWLYSIGQEADLEPARRAGFKALSLDARNVDALIGLGYFHYYGLSDYETALEYFDQAAAIAPGLDKAFYGRSLVLRRMGKFDASLAGFERARELDPMNTNILVDIAFSAREVRAFDKVLAACTRIGRLRSDMPTVELQCQALVGLDGDIERATVVLRESLERFTFWDMYPSTVMTPRSVYLQTEFCRQVILEFELPQEGTRMDEAMLALMQGLIRRDSGDGQEAEVCFRRVVEILAPMIEANPSIYYFYPVLVNTYSALGLHEIAAATCERGLANEQIAKDHFCSTGLSIELAAVYAAVGRDREALDLIEDLLSRPSALSVGMLMVDPAWDPLRDNRRFQDLVADGPVPSI